MRNTKAVIAWWCYGLLAIAWIADMFTPQLFVVAIVLNAPIALSSIALRPALTTRLIVLAEIANVVAGYYNGITAGHHWDAVGIGDRVLSAASFLLVGALTLRSQRIATIAGASGERARRAEHERTLRRAMERVRASLNVDLIARAAVREALTLFGAGRATIILRSAFEVPTQYCLATSDTDVALRRVALDPSISSLVQRARETQTIVNVSPDDPIGRLIGRAVCVVSIDSEGIDASLLLQWEAAPVSIEKELLREFCDGVGVGFEQAHLFLQLSEQNEQIARQSGALQARADIIADIVYALAHDMRTPLIAADTTMQQALSGLYGALPESYRQVLESNVISNAALRRLVETLLLVARFESGEDSRTVEAVDLPQTSERVLSELEPVASRKGVTLQSHGCGVVEADPDEMRRALTNLVANAIEATPTGGIIDVSIERADEAVTVTVSDDGFGVAESRRNSLFQRFGGVRGGTGTGLGLYIVRRIAEKYGGSVRYEPREPKGSRFIVQLMKGRRS